MSPPPGGTLGPSIARVIDGALRVTPVRILLLGRSEGAWPRTLREHPDHRVSELFQTVASSTEIRLDTATSDAGEQFARAGRAFCAGAAVFRAHRQAVQQQHQHPGHPCGRALAEVLLSAGEKGGDASNSLFAPWWRPTGDSCGLWCDPAAARPRDGSLGDRGRRPPRCAGRRPRTM
jgi:hypothetical protein